MFNLTLEEKRTVLFIFTIVLIGLGINFLSKSLPGTAKVVLADENLAKINLNQTTLEGLLDSGCLSAKLATRILTYRDERGKFSDLEELKQVKGVGVYRYNKLKELFYLE